MSAAKIREDQSGGQDYGSADSRALNPVIIVAQIHSGHAGQADAVLGLCGSCGCCCGAVSKRRRLSRRRGRLVFARSFGRARAAPDASPRLACVYGAACTVVQGCIRRCGHESCAFATPWLARSRCRWTVEARASWKVRLTLSRDPKAPSQLDHLVFGPPSPSCFRLENSLAASSVQSLAQVSFLAPWAASFDVASASSAQ